MEVPSISSWAGLWRIGLPKSTAQINRAGGSGEPALHSGGPAHASHAASRGPIALGRKLPHRPGMNAPARWLRAAACCLACLTALPACAEPTGPEPAQSAPTTAPLIAASEARPALWKIASGGTTLYLFGTIHILPEDVAWYKGPVAAALDSADELVTEVPIDETAAAPAIILAASKRTDGKHLRDTLPPGERAGYEGAMALLGLPVQAFDDDDAWFAALMLTLIPLRNAGYDTERGIDAQVAARARARHLPNEAFETAAYQIGLFEHLPEPAQRAYLAEVVDELPTVRSDIDAMVAAWKAGDADHLAQLLNEDEKDPEMRKVLLADRNVAWAKWIEARLARSDARTHTLFIAVGAGHLAGPGSVQDQLAAAGIRVVRVQ